MDPRQFGVAQAADATQALEAFLRGRPRPHHADIEGFGTHRLEHRQVVDLRIVGQRHHRRIGVATAVGDEQRGQLATDLDALQQHAAQGFFARVAEDHLEAQALAELGAGMGDAGIAGQQQALGGTDAQAHALAVAFRPWAVAGIVAQAARAAAQFDLAEQAALAEQRRLQLAQMGLDVAVRRQVFHQYVEDAAAGQAHVRVRVVTLAVAHDHRGIGKPPAATRSRKSSSTQPPDSEPIQWPLAFTASSDPGARGAEP